MRWATRSTPLNRCIEWSPTAIWLRESGPTCGGEGALGERSAALLTTRMALVRALRIWQRSCGSLCADVCSLERQRVRQERSCERLCPFRRVRRAVCVAIRVVPLSPYVREEPRERERERRCRHTTG